VADARGVLVLNMGSSSLKWVVLDAGTEQVLQRGEAHWQGSAGAQHVDELAAALGDVRGVQAIGHRIVHGGATFRDGVRIDDGVKQEIHRLSELAPLHNPAALAGIEAASQRFPDVPQVAAFDTAFHRDIPDPHALYPLPWDWTTRWELRRYGFHGLSVAYAVERTASLLGQVPARLVVCHLGAGCSVTAVERGHSIATSMGFTPLEGVMMVQRAGSVDPGMLLYLLTHAGVTPDDMQRALNDQSGLLGVSGVSTDLREVERAAATGNARARLAIDMFVHRLVMCVGGMVAALNGVDALIFTGGIGEHSAATRASVCGALAYLGVRLAQSEATPDQDIADPRSPVRVLVITAREDLAVLRQLKRVLNWA
jgi:acetate kinase